MHSSLCCCRFGHEDIKKNIPGSQPGLAGSALRGDRVWPGQFPACFWLRPGPASDPGRPAGPGQVLKHWFLVLNFISLVFHFFCEKREKDSLDSSIEREIRCWWWFQPSNIVDFGVNVFHFMRGVWRKCFFTSPYPRRYIWSQNHFCFRLILVFWIVFLWK
jgi:hypothetical protein